MNLIGHFVEISTGGVFEVTWLDGEAARVLHDGHACWVPLAFLERCVRFGLIERAQVLAA